MNEERMMILQMIAEGKIKPEEGAKLLDALGSKKKPSPDSEESEDWEGPEFGIDFADDPFKESFNTSPTITTIPEDTRLIIKSQIGALMLIGTDEPEIKVSGVPRSQYKLIRKNNVVILKTNKLGAALTIHVPRAVTQLDVKSHMGKIVAKNLSHTLQKVDVFSHTGQIRVETETITGGMFKIRSKMGKIEFYLPAESACDVSAATKMGDVDTELPLEIDEDGFGFLRGKLNGGGADVKLVTNMGQIVIGSK
jgi:DUF4097 and DUF4098 domain-containing protein YvlB